MNGDDDLLAEALAGDGAAQERIARERPDLAERLVELEAEGRLLAHATADADDDARFRDRVMGAIATPRAPARAPAGPRRPWLPWSLAAAAGLLLATVITLRFQPAGPAIAWLDAADGLVRIAGEVATAGAGIPREALVAVPEGGGATLRLGDGTRLVAGGGVTMRVEDLSDGITVHLNRGRLAATVTPQPANRRFVMRSPHAEVIVVGTVFALLAAGDGSRLTVEEGSVRIRRLSDGGELAVDAGGTVDVARDRPFAIQRDPPPARTPAARITGFTLCDARSGIPLPGCAPLVDGAVVDLGPLPGRAVNLRADAGPDVDEVRFACDGPGTRRRHNEEVAPYFLYGNHDRGLNPWTPAAGIYRITAIPRDRDGREGVPSAITLTVRR